MLRLDVICTLPDSNGNPRRLFVAYDGRAAAFTPDRELAWVGQLTPDSLGALPPPGRPGDGPWTLTATSGTSITASRFEGCRCQYGHLHSLSEHDLTAAAQA
jgi:hypothetical protein